MPASPRRDRSDIRELLLEAALVEFSRHGYEGASTMAIAKRADAHQPQINYHFSGKAELWRAAVNYLYERLDETLLADDAADEPLEQLVTLLRRYVLFASKWPQLSQITIREAAVDTDRLRWLVETHIRPRQEAVLARWRELCALGLAAPLDERFVHHVLVGAVTLPFSASGEIELLTGVDPFGDEMVQAHADGIIAMLIPGYQPAGS